MKKLITPLLLWLIACNQQSNKNTMEQVLPLQKLTPKMDTLESKPREKKPAKPEPKKFEDTLEVFFTSVIEFQKRNGVLDSTREYFAADTIFILDSAKHSVFVRNYYERKKLETYYIGFDCDSLHAVHFLIWKDPVTKEIKRVHDYGDAENYHQTPKERKELNRTIQKLLPVFIRHSAFVG